MSVERALNGPRSSMPAFLGVAEHFSTEAEELGSDRQRDSMLYSVG